MRLNKFDAPPLKNLTSRTESSLNEKTTEKPDCKTPHKKRGCGCIGSCLGVLLLLILGIGLTVWLAFRSAQKVPEFYAQALEREPESAEFDGDQFEEKIVQLQRAASRRKPWKVEFTDDQINGWIVSDMPQKFPNALPKSINDPRVSFGSNEIKLAFKYNAGKLDGIVVATGDAFCTDQPNVVGLQIGSVKSGFVSLPIGP